MDFSEKVRDNMSEPGDQLTEQEKGGEGEEHLENIKAEWEENPDLEDPRLFSPLQEPGRPEPHERIPDESEEAQTPSEDNQGTSKRKEG
jgi:hypothetical protein